MEIPKHTKAQQPTKFNTHHWEPRVQFRRPHAQSMRFFFFAPLLATPQKQLSQGQAEIHPFGEGSCTRAVTYHLLGLSPPVAELLLAREAAALSSISSPQPACPKSPKKFPPVPGLALPMSRPLAPQWPQQQPLTTLPLRPFSPYSVPTRGFHKPSSPNSPQHPQLSPALPSLSNPSPVP